MVPDDIIKEYFRKTRVNPICFWVVEDTGWSGGVSWFLKSDRYYDRDTAYGRASLIKKDYNCPEQKVRLCYTEIHRTYNDHDEVITETQIRTYEYL